MHEEPSLPPGLPVPGIPVARALVSRRAVRGFLPDPVPRDVIEGILYLAARSPSGTNCQPWNVYVCTGERRNALSRDLLAAHDAHAAGDTAHTPEYAYYAKQWRDPYLARRRALGWAYYGLMGIQKGDRVRIHAQHAKNYMFFGAPVALFFTLDRDLELGSWLDLGMFIEGVMLAARAYELHTIPQAAHNPFHRIVRRHVGIPDNQILACAMALGVIDESARENALKTSRETVSAFARFVD